MKKVVSFLMACMILMPFTLFSAFNVDAVPKISQEITESIDKVEMYSKMADELQLSLKKESKIFDYIDETEFSKAKHIQRMNDLEDLHTYVFKNANDTCSVYYIPEPVKYRDHTGAIVEKDVSLIKNDGIYTMRKNNFDISLPENLTGGVSVSSSYGAVTFVPKEPMNTFSKARTLFDEKSNTVTYLNVFGVGASLRYTPTLSGLKEDIILDRNIGKNQFFFSVYSGDLLLFECDGKFYFAKDKDDKERIALGDIWAYDSSTHFEVGSMKLIGEKNGLYEFSVSVPMSFLESPETVYPVTIDPTIRLTDNTASNSIEDAVLYENLPNMNCGTMLFNDLGSSSYGSAWTAVRFPVLYDEEQYICPLEHNMITSVKFGLKEASGTAAKNIAFYPITTDWTESTATYAGIIGSNNYSSTPITYGSLGNNEAKEFDITSYFVNNEDSTPAERGFVVHVYGYSEADLPYKQFCSSEYSAENGAYRPYLVYSFEPLLTISNIYSNTTCLRAGETMLATASCIPSSTVTWSTSDCTIAEIDENTGSITAVRMGVVDITARAVVFGKEVTNTQKLTIIPSDGTYFFENKKENLYSGVKTGEIGSGQMVLLDDYDELPVKNTNHICQYWILNYVGNNYYTIKLKTEGSASYYLSVNADGEVVLSTTNSSSQQKWKFAFTDSYALKVINKSNSSKCLSVNYAGELLLNRYTNNTDYSDEWYISKYQTTLSVFYDQKFVVRYGADHYLGIINELTEQFNEAMWRTLSFRVTIKNPVQFSSVTDKCITEGQNSVINSGTMNSLCPGFGVCSQCTKEGHQNKCTYYTKIMKSFYDDNRLTMTINNKHPFMLLTGSAFNNADGDEYCTSFHMASYNGLILENKITSWSLYVEQMLPRLIHEFGHELTAPDHGTAVLTAPRNHCVMKQLRHMDLTDFNGEKSFCEDCYSTILNYLETELSIV